MPRNRWTLPSLLSLALAAPGCGSSSGETPPSTTDGEADAQGTVDALAPEVDGVAPDAPGGGDAGDATTASDAPEASSPAGDAATAFAPSNFDPAAVTLTGIGDVAPLASDGACNVNPSGVSCVSRRVFPAVATSVTLANGKSATVVAMKSLTVASNVTLQIAAQSPFILYVLGPVDLQGYVSVLNGDGNTLNPGVGAAPGAALGGSGGSYCGAGGAGANGGLPAPTYGSPSLVPLVAGSFGGGYGSAFPQKGGGALQITSTTSITVGPSAKVVAGGEGGHAATQDAGAGGGASGGALLFEAPTVTIAGSLEVNGGGGGGASVGDDAIDVGAAAGGGSAGGMGAAGTVLAGGDGTIQGSYYGGGGGGVGRIRINTTSGAATLTGTLSPAPGTSCMTQGKLGP